MSGRGRPKKVDGNRNQEIKVRLNAEDQRMLDYICEQSGENRSENLRRALRLVYGLYRNEVRIDGF